MTEIAAAQLVYTNVEADRSPTGRRGEQLWCWTLGLPESVIREAQRRLEDFPNRLTAAEVRNLRRHTFAALPSTGYFMLAQSTPQAKPDKFGRGGRFHAHALLLEAGEFRRIDANPFRILGSFRFDESPEETDPKRTGQRRAELPAVKVSCSDLEPGPASWTSLLGAFARAAFIGRPTLAMTWPRENVLPFLEKVFRRLPQAVRERTGFDTLFAGTPQTASSYRFIANVTLEKLRELGFRDFHLMDLDAVNLPPAPDTGAGWFEAFFRACCELERMTADEVQAAFELGEGLAAGKVPGRLPPGLTDEAVRCAMAATEVRQGDCHWRDMVVADAVPVVIARAFPEAAEAVHRYFSGVGVDGLRRRVEPMPAELVVLPVVRELEGRRAKPAADLIAHLMSMVRGPQTDSVKRLARILTRWSVGPRFERAPQFLRDEDSCQEWFRSWCRETLTESFRTDLGLVRVLLSSRDLSAEEFRECRLGAELLSGIDDDPDFVQEELPPPSPGPVSWADSSSAVNTTQPVSGANSGQVSEATQQTAPRSLVAVVHYLITARAPDHKGLPPPPVADYLWNHWVPMAGFQKDLCHLVDRDSTNGPDLYWGVAMSLQPWHSFTFSLLRSISEADTSRAYSEFVLPPRPNETDETQIIRWSPPEDLTRRFRKCYDEMDLMAQVDLIRSKGDLFHRWVANTYVFPNVGSEIVARQSGSALFVGRHLLLSRQPGAAIPQKTRVVAEAVATSVLPPLSIGHADRAMEMVVENPQRFRWLLGRFALASDPAST